MIPVAGIPNRFAPDPEKEPEKEVAETDPVTPKLPVIWAEPVKGNGEMYPSK